MGQQSYAFTDFPLWFRLVYKHIRFIYIVATSPRRPSITWVAKIVPLHVQKRGVYMCILYIFRKCFYFVSDRWTKRDFCEANSSAISYIYGVLCVHIAPSPSRRHPYKIPETNMMKIVHQNWKIKRRKINVLHASTPRYTSTRIHTTPLWGFKKVMTENIV